MYVLKADWLLCHYQWILVTLHHEEFCSWWILQSKPSYSVFVFLKGTLVSLNFNSNFIAYSQGEWEQVWHKYALSYFALIYHNTIEMQIRSGKAVVVWVTFGGYKALLSWIFSRGLVCIPWSCNNRCTIYCSMWGFLFVFKMFPHSEDLK